MSRKKIEQINLSLTINGTKKMGKIKLPLIYLASVVFINWCFVNIPVLPTPLGFLPPATFIVGGLFVFRDYVQRSIGHYVLIPMLLGCVASYFLASPEIAIASASAFIVSEIADWFVFTVIRKPFHHRVLYSSLVGVMVDTLIFLPMIGQLSLASVIIMFASKMVVAVIVFINYNKRK